MGYVATPMSAPENSEIKGQAVLDWTNNLEQDFTEPIFKELDLDPTTIDPEGWYSLKIIAKLYRAIYEGPNGMSALTAMGKASAPGVMSLIGFESPEEFVIRGREPFLASIRNIPEEYGLLVNKIGEKHYELTNNSIVPNSMIYGYIWGMMAEFRKQIDTFVVKPIKGYSDGGEVGATFEVTWS